MKVSLIALFILTLFAFPLTSLASNKNSSYLKDGFCTDGSHQQLYNFFAEKDYIVIAQGKRTHPSGEIKDFADVIFLVSPNMEYFHAVTLNGIKYDHFKACIFSSAREIDYQFAPPMPNLLTRQNREHVVFLTSDIPKNISCSSNDQHCITWNDWSHHLKQTFLLSAYLTSSNWENDLYNEIVELTLNDKKIRPSRGKLAQHARKKYALRLRNESNESKEERQQAKTAYKQIHDEVDHKLALVILSLTETRDWALSEVNRTEGLVHKTLNGIELELYPAPISIYKKFAADFKTPP